MINKLRHRKTLYLFLTLLFLLVVAVGYVYLNKSKRQEIIPSNTSSTKQGPSSASATITDTPVAADSTASNNPKYAAPETSGSVLAPSGTFVSNHRPSLSGSSAQRSEQSTCNTTPGATCYIKFTQGSTIKTLQAQTTNQSGAAFWDWNIDDSGLTEGVWQVSAIATFGGITKTTTDGIALEVQE